MRILDKMLRIVNFGKNGKIDPTTVNVKVIIEDFLKHKSRSEQYDELMVAYNSIDEPKWNIFNEIREQSKEIFLTRLTDNKYLSAPKILCSDTNVEHVSKSKIFEQSVIDFLRTNNYMFYTEEDLRKLYCCITPDIFFLNNSKIKWLEIKYSHNGNIRPEAIEDQIKKYQEQIGPGLLVYNNEAINSIQRVTFVHTVIFNNLGDTLLKMIT